MTDPDDLCRALDEASANPPAEPARSAAIRTRGARIRLRRRLLATATAVVTVAGGASVITVLRHDGSGTDRLVTTEHPTVHDASPTDGAASSTPTGTPTPAPTSTPTATRGTTTRGTSPAPVATATRDESTSPPPPGATASPSPTETTTPESLTFAASVSADPASGRDYPITIVRIRVTGTVIGGIKNRPTLFMNPNQTISYDEAPDQGCTDDGALHSVDTTFTFRDVYRQPGPFPVTLGLTTGVCGSWYYQNHGHDWTTTIDVPFGSTHENGASQPHFYDGFREGKVVNGHVEIRPAVFDEDGFVSDLSVDWGNGGSPTRWHYDGCDDGNGRYWVAGGAQQAATSPTLAAGTYTVTVTATSTGCTGKDAQTATESQAFTVPAG